MKGATPIRQEARSDIFPLARLFQGYSIEIGCRDTTALMPYVGRIEPATQVSITNLGTETTEDRVGAGVAMAGCGLTPMVHIAARRLASEAALDDLLVGLKAVKAVERVFLIAGDTPQPLGPYPDALSLIRSGKLERHGVRHVGISGYPEGHPNIQGNVLRTALLEKQRALTERGLTCEIITQFGFDADATIRWLTDLRIAGVTEPVRVGVAGPASVKSLLRFAARCGVGASTRMLAKYGIEISKLFSTATPDAMLAEIAERLDSHELWHGVRLHLYPFGGIDKTIQWASGHAAGHASSNV